MNLLLRTNQDSTVETRTAKRDTRMRSGPISVFSQLTQQTRPLLRSILRKYLEWNSQLLLDPWLRYHPALRLLGETFPHRNPRILDVGSGSLGIASFLKWPIVGLDVHFSRGNGSPLMRRVQGSATHLPFPDRSFDVVVSMDTIEHLPAAERLVAIREILRVASGMVILGFPYGKRSARFDEEALDFETLRGVKLPWREEHVRHGTPNELLHEEILHAVRSTRPEMTIRWFGQEGLFGLMLRWKLQFLIDRDRRTYGLVFAPLYWVHARGQRRRSYRRVYVARRKRSD